MFRFIQVHGFSKLYMFNTSCFYNIQIEINPFHGHLGMTWGRVNQIKFRFCSEFCEIWHFFKETLRNTFFFYIQANFGLYFFLHSTTYILTSVLLGLRQTDERSLKLWFSWYFSNIIYYTGLNGSFRYY